MEKALPFFILLAAGGAYLYFSNKKTVELFENMGPAKMPISKEQTLAQTTPKPPVEPSKGVQSELERIKQLEQSLSLFLNKEGKRIQAETSNPAIILPLQRAYADNEKLKKELQILKNNNAAPISLTSQILFDMEQNLVALRSYSSKLEEGFTSETGNRATPKQLQDFLIKVESEIIRLSASGTTEPVIQRRIQQLKLMSQELEDIILKLQSGLLKPEEVPVYETDIMNSLPLLGKPDEPLPQLIKLANLPTGFQNLLPGLDTQDPQMRQVYANLINNYKDGLSWYVDGGIQYAGKNINEGFTGVNEEMQKQLLDGAGFHLKGGLKYISPNEVKLAESCKKTHANFSLNNHNGTTTISKTGFPSINDINNVSDSGTNDIDNGQNIVEDMYASNPLDENREPAHFDWRALSLHICEQIRKRGLTPSDFGCMTTAPDGNWRGYTRMLCNRLVTTTDPGLPEICGCPPDNWRGWGLPRW
jgi:hypothetical protein